MMETATFLLCFKLHNKFLLTETRNKMKGQQSESLVLTYVIINPIHYS
jgi:hypothetical protein